LRLSQPIGALRRCECHRIDASTARRRGKKFVLFFARLSRRAAAFDGNLAA
jgi:hypothetical protein